jgi:glc operon protein GlcG
MRKAILASMALGAMIFATDARAQQAGPPEYGPGMNLEVATKAVNAAMAEAKKNGWNLAIAVTTNGGHLVHFSRMDNTQFGSIKIAQHKARTSATFKRPTKAFADAIAANPANVALLSLDDVIASEGGIPLMLGGKMIGAIGCSGATGAQDGVACTAGANALK